MSEKEQTTFEVGRTYPTRGGKTTGKVERIHDGGVFSLLVRYSDGPTDWLTMEGEVAPNWKSRRDLLPTAITEPQEPKLPIIDDPSGLYSVAHATATATMVSLAMQQQPTPAARPRLSDEEIAELRLASAAAVGAFDRVQVHPVDVVRIIDQLAEANETILQQRAHLSHVKSKRTDEQVAAESTIATLRAEVEQQATHLRRIGDHLGLDVTSETLPGDIHEAIRLQLSALREARETIARYEELTASIDEFNVVAGPAGDIPWTMYREIDFDGEGSKIVKWVTYRNVGRGLAREFVGEFATPLEALSALQPPAQEQKGGG